MPFSFDNIVRVETRLLFPHVLYVCRPVTILCLLLFRFTTVPRDPVLSHKVFLRSVIPFIYLKFLSLLDFKVGLDHSRGLKFHQTRDLQNDLNTSQSKLIVDLVAELLFGKFKAADKFFRQGLRL